ncbi:MAG: hypothetical protein F6K55_29070 [Moorea sp. SIO4A3]|nr:hypothetical protein [Moorena sp. SIO4A3]
MRNLSSRFISAIISAAITVFVPRYAYAGVVVQLDSEFELDPSMLSYKGQYLRAVIDGKQLEVRISPNLILEALEILEQTNRDTFQISINPTSTSESASYIDFPLRDTEIGKAFYEVDKRGLSYLLNHLAELPEGAPPHPDDVAQQLLETETDYNSLPVQVGIPSSISLGSQTYLSFDPSAPGLVDIQFKPLIVFLYVRGQYLAVDERLQTFVERPYLPLAEDIRSRPLEYRNNLPSLERAAAITAAMGLINVGCQEARSCAHLLRQSLIAKLSQSLRQPRREPSLTSSYILARHWRNFSSVTWEPGDNAEAWSAFYNALCQVLANLGNSETLSKVKDLILQQFKTYSIPDEALLQAASAVVYAWDGNANASEQSLQRAIELSEESFEDRFEVANIGLHVSSILKSAGDEEKADEIYLRMKSIRDQAQVAAFDKTDKLLQDCEHKSISCSLDDLLMWEAEAFRAGLFGTSHLWLANSSWFFQTDGSWDVPDRDVAWLHGRFAYLIGIRLDGITARLNRLRYLESSTSDASPANRSHLESLLGHFRDSLELAPD